MAEITTEQVKSVIESARTAIRIGKSIALITPTAIDDKGLEIADQVLTMIEPFAGEPWVANMANFVLGLFAKHKDNPEVAMRELQEAFA